MGHLKEKYGFDIQYDIKKGSCPECGEEHSSNMAHNAFTFVYRLKFYDKHGRFPTWKDAMSHLADEDKDFCIYILQRENIDVNALLGMPDGLEDAYRDGVDKSVNYLNEKGYAADRIELKGIVVSADTIKFIIDSRTKGAAGAISVLELIK